MLSALLCPVSGVRIDRNVVRVTGLVTTLCLAAYVWTGSAFIIVPLALDYGVRMFLDAPPSPMARMAAALARALGIPQRVMDKAPKVFASRIGFSFAAAAAVTHFAAPTIAPWIAGALALFTTLESVFDLCVGCVVYTYIALPLFRARDVVAKAAGVEPAATPEDAAP